MAEVDLERVQFVVEEEEPLLVAGDPYSLWIQTDRAFDSLSNELTSAINDEVIPSLARFCLEYSKEDKEKVEENFFQRMKESVDSFKVARLRDRVKGMAYHATGLFVIAGLDHQNKKLRNYLSLYRHEWNNYRRYSKMNDAELREALRPTVEDEERFDTFHYGRVVTEAVKDMMRSVGRNPERFPLTAEEMVAIIAQAGFDEKDEVRGRSIMGLKSAENDHLSKLVVTTLVERKVLEEGKILLWGHPDNEDVHFYDDPDLPEDFDRSNQAAWDKLEADREIFWSVPRLKLRQFVLRTVVAS